MTALPEDGPALRAAVIEAARGMNAAGINVNTSGNVSARCQRGAHAGFVITPSGMPYRDLRADDIVFVSADGLPQGSRMPSSEWLFHRDLYADRLEFAAIVHTHSPCATALSCHGRPIPAFHYMVARAGGVDIRCAPYATFGTQALSDHAIEAMRGRSACLLAHHGVIACGPGIESALALAIEVEHLARIYLAACELGEPPRLDASEMQRVVDRFRTYGTGAYSPSRS
jgi:L-ribulose-5-phosphate 4-epimerase